MAEPEQLFYVFKQGSAFPCNVNDTPDFSTSTCITFKNQISLYVASGALILLATPLPLHCRVLLQFQSAALGRRAGGSSRRAFRQTGAVAYTGGSPATERSTQTWADTVLPPLSSTELHRAALLARLSGLCYYPPDQLEDRLASEGMKLVISGGTRFTRYSSQSTWQLRAEPDCYCLLKPHSGSVHPFCRWLVADGPLDREEGPTWPAGTFDGEMNSQLNGDSRPSQNGAAAVAKGRQPATERVILLRGVVWQGQDVDAFKLWQDLMRFWPTAFAREHTEPPGILLAHAGQLSELTVSRYWVEAWAAGFKSEKQLQRAHLG